MSQISLRGQRILEIHNLGLKKSEIMQRYSVNAETAKRYLVSLAHLLRFLKSRGDSWWLH